MVYAWLGNALSSSDFSWDLPSQASLGADHEDSLYLSSSPGCWRHNPGMKQILVLCSNCQALLWGAIYFLEHPLGCAPSLKEFELLLTPLIKAYLGLRSITHTEIMQADLQTDAFDHPFHREKYHQDIPFPNHQSSLEAVIVIYLP
jgi:hypothetical protein